MTKSMTNLLVDTVLGLAFAVTAVTGIILLLPAGWLADGSLLGVGYQTWLTLHNWGGIFIIVGVTLHVLLHLRWIGRMLRRLARRPRSERPGRQPSALAVEPRPEHALASRARVTDEAQTGDTGYTRRQVLGGAALTFGAAFVGGLFADRLGDIQSTATSESGGSAQYSTGAADAGSADETGDDGETSSSTTTDQTGTARVSVNADACVGCGHCLRTCPEGVFAADPSGSYAVAQYPDACVLCRRCLGVCPAAAITLSS